MNQKDYILFDLDGTLTDPKEGITKSVRHALNHYGCLLYTSTDLMALCHPVHGADMMKGEMCIRDRPTSWLS